MWLKHLPCADIGGEEYLSYRVLLWNHGALDDKNGGYQSILYTAAPVFIGKYRVLGNSTGRFLLVLLSALTMNCTGVVSQDRWLHFQVSSHFAP